MECPKCKRKLPVKKSTCFYCGASLDGAYSNHKSRIDITDKNAVIVDEQHAKVELTDLKESDSQKFEDAIREGKDGIIEKSQTQIEEISSVGKEEPQIALSLEKILTILEKLKDAYNDGQIDYGNYKQTVVEIVKDYISTLDNDVKINFVVNEISASELSKHLDDEMLKDLRAFVITSVSENRNS